ncbi:MAG: polysaccharide deacetylase family protein [Flavobacteriales bacterium]|jgi:peptidoglycan/xylan/chitin deacetylase (PgdA/CDA1 family)
MIGEIGIFNVRTLILGKMKELIKNAYKSFAGETEYLFGQPFARKTDILILALHSTPKSHQPSFESLVEWTLKHYVPLSPKDLLLVEANPERYTEGPYVIFTFDDGLKNNLYSAQYLSSRGVDALYFVVPHFIEASNSEEYYIQYIRPNPDRKIDNTKDDVSSMTWEDLKQIQALGHTIGSHTMTHRLHSKMTEEEIKFEIIQSKSILSERLGSPIDHFASPNNTLWSVNSVAAALIKENYKFHHTTIPGIFDISLLEKGALYRRNVECHWPSGRIKFAMGYYDLRRWQAPQAALFHLVP